MSRSFRLTFTVYLLGLIGALLCDRHFDPVSPAASPLVADRAATGDEQGAH